MVLNVLETIRLIRDGEKERELRAQNFITQGLRFYAVACSYNLSQLIYMRISYT